MLRPPAYHYRGFHGPWLEEHFHKTWMNSSSHGAAYVPIFFDSFFFHSQYHAFLPVEFSIRYRAIWRILGQLAESPRPYFTLLGMYEFPIWEWHLFPRNIVVAASAGYGDLAIPLLKGDRPLTRRNKDIRISFMGALGGPSNALNVRAEMAATFLDIAHFGEGPDWETIMRRSDFSLCPRGQGPTSFRLFEALSVASIPVYIWKGRCWLPFTNEVDWSSIAIIADAENMRETKREIAGATPEAINAKQDRIAEIYDKFFRYDSACARIRRHMQDIGDRAAAEALTVGRATGANGGATMA
jgi:hypothetical protein